MYKQLKERPSMMIYAWVVFGLAALFYTYEYLLRIEPSVMFRSLMAHFQISAGSFGILVALYYFAYTPLQLIVGLLTDRFGPKRVLTTAIGFCVLGSFLFGISDSVYIAGLGRILIGVGSAFAFVGVLKLAAMWLPKRYFALVAGITTGLGMLGAIFGDVELSWLVTRIGWKPVVLYSALAGLLLIPIFVFVVKERQTEKRKIHQHPKLLSVLKGFWRICKTRQIVLAGVIGGLLYLSLSVFAELWGIPFIHSTLSLAKAHAAELNAMVFIGWLVGAPLMGWFSDWMKSRRIPLIIGGIGAAICIGVLLVFTPHNFYLFGALLFLFGVFCSAQVVCFAIARDHVEMHLTATALGVVNLIVMFCGAVLQPVVGFILDLRWQGQLIHGVHFYRPSDYRTALIILPLIILVAGILAFFVKPATKRIHHVGSY